MAVLARGTRDGLTQRIRVPNQRQQVQDEEREDREDADERAVEPPPASLEARELGIETTVSLCSAISLSFLSRSSARSSSIILLIAFSVKLLA